MKNEEDEKGIPLRRRIFRKWISSLLILASLSLFVAALAAGNLAHFSSSETVPFFFISLLTTLVFSIPVGLFFSKQLTRSLNLLKQGIKQITLGDFSFRLRLHSGDEMEDLGRDLNQMAEQLGNQWKDISQNQTQFSAILEGMIEGILILNREGKVLMVNPPLNRMFSLQTPLQKETYFYELLRYRELNEFIRKVLAERKNLSLDIAFTHPRESFFQVQSSIAPEDSERKDFYVILVFHEITEIKRLERIRTDFVANVSHELRTPLTSIKGYLEAFSEMEFSLPADGKKFLSILQKQSERMENIVSDLLQLAKIESGQEKLQLSPIPVKPFLEKTVSSLSPLAQKKNQTLDLHAPENLILQADPDKLSRILINLLENAIKYTPEKGKIVVGCHKKNGCIDLFVKDNGIGIPPADQTRIFERFYRVDRARSHELGGTGLGLAIVKHLMEAHGGSIGVESYPNEGSTFTARFPASQN